MKRLTEYSRTDSLSYRVVTHDRKGREGKGIGRDVGNDAFPTYEGGTCVAPAPTRDELGEGMR